MSAGFYRALEDKHRGTRELILSRLRVYLSFVTPLVALDSHAEAVDLGCGRGEWLELMAEIGCQAHGVDQDQGMLDGCLERGLRVELGDAISYLTSIPSESKIVVSAFHLVEHLGFAALQSIALDSLRVLKPGGLLIIETPNPENVLVATRNFYVDPTHKKMIPPQLLCCLLEYLGYARVKVIRLHEDPRMLENGPLTLLDVLGNSSPDYAIIAQKASDGVPSMEVDAAFDAECGITLDSLAARYHEQFETAIRHATATAQQAEIIAKIAEERAALALQVVSALRPSPLRRVMVFGNWCIRQAKRLREDGAGARGRALASKVARRILRRHFGCVEGGPSAPQAQRGLWGRLQVKVTSLLVSFAIRYQYGGEGKRTPRASFIFAQLKEVLDERRGMGNR